MANNSLLTTSQLDFNELKSSLKTFLTGQTSLSDYDFEGSNISVLIDLLTYNTFLNAQYLNMVGSEMFLDTAKIRDSIVSHAKELNYVPRSRISSRVTVDVTITPNDAPSAITIPKNYAIRTTIDSVTYNFVTDAPIVIKNSSGVYTANSVTFYEGEVVNEVFTANVTLNSDGTYNSYGYILSSENIDVNSIEVSVQNSVSDTTTTVFTKADNFFGITSESNKFFIEGYKANQYRIVFGNNIIGKALKNGNVVTVSYRDTVGSVANKATSFTKTSSIDGYASISLNVSGASYGGAERESNEDIVYAAPRHFQTQERAVTASDFKTLLLNKFPQIQAVSAYGGEEATPKQYGRVVICVKPYGNVGIVTDSLKNQIIQYLKLKSLTTEPVMVDAEYFYLEITSKVYYDLLLASVAANELKTDVITNILTLNDSMLNDFGKNVLYSKIVKTIDNTTTNGAITSNDTSLRMVYRWTPTVNQTATTTVSFDNELSNEGARYAYPEGHEKIITSSVFTYTYDGVDYACYLSDDGLGSLKIYTVNDGTEIVLNSNVGTVDYTTGELSFTTQVKGYIGRINIYARLEAKNITVRKNKFLIIDSSDINIEMIATNDE